MALTPTACVEPEGQSRHRAEVVLELTRLRTDVGPVTAVVYPRCHLVAQQPIAHVEQFDREHADVVELGHDRRRDRLRLLLQCRLEVGGGSQRQSEDAVAMMVLDQRVGGGGAVTCAHGDDRQLAIETHERFEQRRQFAHRTPGVLGEQRIADHRLALAVVAEPPGLQDGGRADPSSAAVSSSRESTAS